MICQNSGFIATHIQATHSGSEDRGAIPICSVNASKTVLAGFSSCWGLYLFEPGKLDATKMTLTWIVPGEREQKVDGRKFNRGKETENRTPTNLRPDLKKTCLNKKLNTLFKTGCFCCSAWYFERLSFERAKRI